MSLLESSVELLVVDLSPGRIIQHPAPFGGRLLS